MAASAARVGSGLAREHDGCGSRAEHVARVGAPWREHRVLGAVEGVGVLRCGVGRVGGDPDDHRLASGHRRVERLVPGDDGAEADDVDGVIVGELLAAGLPLLFGLGDEARVQLERVPADAAELGVDVSDGGLGARSRLGDRVRAALAVDPTDGDRGHALVGCAGGAAREAQVVGDDRLVSAGRRRRAGGAGGGGGTRRCSGAGRRGGSRCCGGPGRCRCARGGGRPGGGGAGHRGCGRGPVVVIVGASRRDQRADYEDRERGSSACAAD